MIGALNSILTSPTKQTGHKTTVVYTSIPPSHPQLVEIHSLYKTKWQPPSRPNRSRSPPTKSPPCSSRATKPSPSPRQRPAASSLLRCWPRLVRRPFTRVGLLYVLCVSPIRLMHGIALVIYPPPKRSKTGGNVLVSKKVTIVFLRLYFCRSTRLNPASRSQAGRRRISRTTRGRRPRWWRGWRRM